MILLYVSGLHQEVPMEKKLWKRRKEEYIRSPTFIYTKSCKEDRGEINRQRDLTFSIDVKGGEGTKAEEKY
jgi:hypothetical protein